MPLTITDERTNSQTQLGNLKPNAVFCETELPNICYILTKGLSSMDRTTESDGNLIALNLETSELVIMPKDNMVVILDAVMAIKK